VVGDVVQDMGEPGPWSTPLQPARRGRLERITAGLRFKPPESGRTCTFAIPDFAIAELRRLKREPAEQLLVLGMRQTGDTLSGPRFDGEPWQPRSLTHEFTVMMRRL